jgi:hypothetical protein
LPGLVGSAAADGPAERWSLEHSSSYYAEADLDDDRVAIGNETARYEILTQQFRLTAPFTPRTDVRLDLTHESMSGATPWFVEPDANGEPVQVMSGATIEEERVDVLATGNYYLDNGRFSIQGGVSSENDYFAGNGGIEAVVDFPTNTSLTTGLGFSFDTLEPTDADLFVTRVEKERKQSYTLFAGLSQVMSQHSVVQTSLSYQGSRGFLSDPYKLVSVGGVNLADSRPSKRHQLAWLTRYRHHFSPVAGTLHADYRFSVDDWGLSAHMLELAWYQSLWETVRLVPSVRYYSQSEAEFHAPFFAALPSDGYASSDYRLSPYGALSWKLRAETRLPSWPFGIDWLASISWERYESRADLALENVAVANPGLVDFDVFTLRLVGRF